MNSINEGILVVYGSIEIIIIHTVNDLENLCVTNIIITEQPGSIDEYVNHNHTLYERYRNYSDYKTYQQMNTSIIYTEILGIV